MNHHPRGKGTLQAVPESTTLPKTFSLRAYFVALRPQQWTKNLIVFAAPLFAFSITLETILGSLLAFSLFCCVSSSFYLFNDIVDVKDDRAHPVKCKRPIASGLVPVPIAVGMAISLLAIALYTSFSHSQLLGGIVLSYAILQVAYNFKLKRLVIIDVIVISLGFVLRAYSGAVATQIALSLWFVLCTAMLALFLAIEKRKAEYLLLQSKGGKTRSVLRFYTSELLNRMESAVVAGTITTYSLWSAGPDLRGASTPWMMLTLPFVLYGIFRYQLLSSLTAKEPHSSKTERPEKVLINDLPILLTVMLWVAAIVVILLLEKNGVVS